MSGIKGSDDYERARGALRAAEIALMEQRERVAQLRRGLPPGPRVEKDYVFRDGQGDVRLSQLFGREGHDTLLVYHFMYGAAQTQPCPMCTMWLDGLNSIAPHLRQNMGFVVSARAPIDDLLAYGEERGWGALRLLSSQDCAFNADMEVEDADGAQWPAMSVFVRTPSGEVQQSWSGGARMDDEHFRGLDLLSPVWNLLDLTPAGRASWMPKRSYD
jgi:predicted dithiol-disulfide oxidoreductase (DUF899 family)